MNTLLDFLTWLASFLDDDAAALALVTGLADVEGVSDNTPTDEAIEHLSDADVETLVTALVAAAQLDDVNTDDLVQLADSIDYLRSLAESRAITAEADELARQALLARISMEGDDDDEAVAEEADETADEDENEDADVKEAVLASARKPRTAKTAAAAKRHKPAPVVNETTAFTHSRTTAGISRGEELSMVRPDGSNRDKSAGAAVAAAIRDLSGMSGPIPKEYVLHADYLEGMPEARRLREGDDAGNSRKVAAAIDSRRLSRNKDSGGKLDALIAAGGLCAPLMPYYPLMELGSNRRPVRDALPGFGMDRGGIVFQPPPSFASGDFDAGVAVWTAANDANPTDPSVKPFLELACNTNVEVEGYAVTNGVLVSNFRQRSYPEQVDVYLNGSGLRHAEVAETALITGIAAGSVQQTQAAAVLGIARDLFFTIEEKATILRDIHRMDAETLDVYLPHWIRNAIRMDILREMPGRPNDPFGTADAMIDEWFRLRNVRVIWFIDTQNYVPFQAGIDQEFHNHVTWYMHPTGSFLFLDGGTLDVGVFRDKGMVELNQYAIFSETFEAIAAVGIDTAMIKVTQPVCINGAASGVIDPDECSVS